MAKIYTRAKRVLIWLGDEDENTANAIYCLKSFARLKDVSLGELALKGLDADISFRPWLLDGNNKAHIQHVHWRALKQLLLERPWFRRTWVYQEIVMATKAIIICGTHIIDWDILYATCDTIDALNIYTGERRGGGKTRLI